MAFFGLTVQPNLLADTQLPAPLSVTNAALPHSLRDSSAKSGRSTVSVSIEDGEFIPICTLIPGVVEQHKLDLVFEEGSTLRLKVEGGNPVALSGYFQNDDEGLDEMDEEDLLRLAAMREAEENEDEDEDESDDEDFDPESMQVDGESDEEEDDEDDEEEEVDTAALEAAVKRQVAEKAAAQVKADAEKTKKAAAAAAAEAEKAKKAAAAEKKRKAESPAQDAAEPAAKKSKAEPLPKPVTLKGGLVIQDLTPADPTAPRAKAGQRIGMRYIGKLKNGKIFDQNTKGQPFSFKLGKGEVISGWDAGIPGMAVGQRRQLTIPAKMAYGKRGAPPEIPPNADLIFEVKLLQIYK
ncbi:hypothetical protein BCR44DRAFT_137829 [Catenaria anguillulae PL171]|uniref:peptidylprolyl isomerase n=1 Tax=Catenaria anguillulae PL171 TaxID=765915 RepID=A0A1Y2HQ01_9FUNG|nr:hypothetical protein BCR44DRAFT_137829 [Catenaria anguillulae PL171]